MNKKQIIFTILVVIIAIAAFFVGSKYGNKPTVPVKTPQTQTATTTQLGTDNDGMEDEHEFLQADYNFDGYPDRLKMLDCGATGNCSYEVDLYDSKTKNYVSTIDATDVNDKVTFEVTNPVVSKTDQLVCSYANIGAGTYHISVYKYSVKDNTYAQIKEFSGSTDNIHKCSLK